MRLCFSLICLIGFSIALAEGASRIEVFLGFAASIVGVLSTLERWYDPYHRDDE